MPRTIVYPSPANQSVQEGKGLVESKEGAHTQPPDDFADKLVKYIPGEVLAFFLPAWALFANDDATQADSTSTWRWIVFVVALSATVGYLLMRAPKKGDNPAPPHWYFYVLSALAFVAWAIGTTNAGETLFCLSELGSKFIILAAVLLIPMIDGLLTRYGPPSA